MKPFVLAANSSSHIPENRQIPEDRQMDPSMKLNSPIKRTVLKLKVLGLALALTLVPHVAVADSALSQMLSYSVMAGMFVEVGKAEYSGMRGNPGMPLAVGFRYQERQGIITGTLTAIAIVVAAAAAAGAPKSQRSWESGGYRYTETTYHSEAEKAAIMAGGAAAAAGAASSKNQTFDIEIFSRNLGGDVSGWRMNGYYGFPFAENFMFEFGMGFGSIDTAMRKDNQSIYVSHGYFGMPFRFMYANEHFITFIESQWNWLGHLGSSKSDPEVDPTSGTILIRSAPVLPWKIGIASNLFGRIYGEFDISTPGIISGEFAAKAGFGLRF